MTLSELLNDLTVRFQTVENEYRPKIRAIEEQQTRLENRRNSKTREWSSLIINIIIVIVYVTVLGYAANWGYMGSICKFLYSIDFLNNLFDKAVIFVENNNVCNWIIESIKAFLGTDNETINTKPLIALAFLALVPFVICIFNAIIVAIVNPSIRRKYKMWEKNIYQKEKFQLSSDLAKLQKEASSIVRGNPLYNSIPNSLRCSSNCYQLYRIVASGQASSLEAALDIFYDRAEAEYQEYQYQTMVNAINNAADQTAKLQREVEKLREQEELAEWARKAERSDRRKK